MSALYDSIGINYAELRKPDRRIAGIIENALGSAETILNVGAGTGSYEPADRSVIAVEPSREMIRKRNPAAAAAIQASADRMPFEDKSFDYVTIVDVLHHTDDPTVVLSEAARVARHGVIIKDHLREGFLARETLAFMDWLGNFGDGVPMPYNFLSRSEWQGAFFKSKLQSVETYEKLDIYLPPGRWLFDRSLHFVSYLAPKAA